MTLAASNATTAHRPAAADAPAPAAERRQEQLVNLTADPEDRGPLDAFIPRLQDLLDARVDEAAWRSFDEVLHELMEEVGRTCQLKPPLENTSGAVRRRTVRFIVGEGSARCSIDSGT